MQTVTKAHLDKSSRFTDWSRRPLSSAQITYAIADVTHLRDIYTFLLGKLELSSRVGWLSDEMRTLTSPATYEQHPDRAWERFRNRARKPRDPRRADGDRGLARGPRRRAATCRAPRVLKDDIMIEVALAAPQSEEALGELRAFPKGMERSRAGAEIVQAVARGLARDPKTLPKLDRDRRNGGGGATVELLKVLLRQVSESHGVAAKMIATVDDLEAIASDDHADVAALAGWRRDLFGAKALGAEAWDAWR